MTTAIDFLPAILVAPDDDTPRLVFADWLEENTETVPCRECAGKGYTDEGVVKQGGTRFATYGPCKPCYCTGRVPDGRAERAEFIRVQVELARPQTREPWCHHDLTMPDHCPRCRLRRREQELLHANVDWCDEVWPVPNHHWHPIEGGFLSADAGAELRFRRGFVEVLTCTAADWLAHGPAVVACQPVRVVTLTTSLTVVTRWVRDELHVRFAGDRDSVVLGPGELAVLESYPAQLRRAALVWLAETWPGIHFTLPR